MVIPTVGRPSLRVLLDSLAAGHGPLPDRVVIVDDRRGCVTEPAVDIEQPPVRLQDRLVLLRSGGRGPAGARNVGWREASGDCEWVAFVDDDVVLPRTWLVGLRADLAAAGERVAGVQGRVSVPLPAHRRPSDWERGTAGLAEARWITADMAYRRAALVQVAGFDERFPRAFREDADLALRVQDAGWQLSMGSRWVIHPVRPARWSASLKQQRGNMDDPLMRRLHGPGWGQRACAPPGRRARHATITAAAAATVGAGLARRRRASRVAAMAWLAGTAEFAYSRIQPGPRTPAELTSMLATSVLIPPAAIAYWLRGCWRWRSAAPWECPEEKRQLPKAVLFDRDGTLVHDVPYNGDPARVSAMPGAAAALADLRDAGVRVGVVSNQSGIARGRITAEQVRQVNARVEALLGGFDVWAVCPHTDADGCGCRKPAPGLVHSACQALGVVPSDCTVIGDIAADVDAAQSAGARGILVPTARTRPQEVAAAPIVAYSLRVAVALVRADADGPVRAP